MAEIGTDIEKAKQLLIEGKLVAIPTDTVYGLAGDMMNEDAILDIFKTKERPPTVPLIALSDSIEKLEKVVKQFPSDAQKLSEKFWPGGLTIVLDKKINVSDLMTANLDTLGVRIPADKLTLALLESMGRPLAVTSANIHGHPSPIDASQVNNSIGDRIDYILDGGACKGGIESTIVGFEKEQLKVFRKGAISLPQIEECLSNK